jgi:hypothetical protein
MSKRLRERKTNNACGVLKSRYETLVQQAKLARARVATANPMSRRATKAAKQMMKAERKSWDVWADYTACIKQKK